MHTDVSKSQIIKLVVMGVILVIVLLFRGQIKDGIASLRNRSQQSRSRIDPKKMSSSRLKMSRHLIKELEKTSTEKNLKPMAEEWPEQVKRDIFRFQEESLPASNTKERKKKVKREKNLVRLKLEATFTGDEPLAVINNQPLMLDQKISGYTLKEIQQRQVILTGRGQKIILRLGQEKKCIQ